MKPALHVLACIASQITVIGLLATRRGQLWSNGQQQTLSRLPISASVIRYTGLVAAVFTIRLAFVVAPRDPLMLAGLRIACFFYACKLLDLALTKSDTPPKLWQSEKNGTEQKPEASMETCQDHAKYVWLLLTQMRYQSFDIAVVQKNRQEPTSRLRSVTEPTIGAIIVGVLAYTFEAAELKCLCLLLLLQTGFEFLHTLLHPPCPHPVFYKPLSASTMSSFWTTHWHACANSWLHSLAYRPARRHGGRWFGVLATFNLTGTWHGWASAALVDDSHAVLLGLQVWALFVVMGVVCLVERWIWGERQGGVVQKVVVWVVALVEAGQCFRTLQRYSKIPWLKQDPI